MVAQLDARLIGDREVAGLTPVGRQHSFMEIEMKYCLRSFSPFHLFKQGICQFLVKECAQSGFSLRNLFKGA